MNLPSISKITDNSFSVSGELNMQTVPAISTKSRQLFSGLAGTLTIDLSGVSRADSAGLALMIDWLRVARRNQFRLQFMGLPEQLLQIARVSELQQILPIK